MWSPTELLSASNASWILIGMSLRCDPGGSSVTDAVLSPAVTSFLLDTRNPRGLELSKEIFLVCPTSLLLPLLFPLVSLVAHPEETGGHLLN